VHTLGISRKKRIINAGQSGKESPMNSTIDATQDSRAADRIAAFRQRASKPVKKW